MFSQVVEPDRYNILLVTSYVIIINIYFRNTTTLPTCEKVSNKTKCLREKRNAHLFRQSCWTKDSLKNHVCVNPYLREFEGSIEATAIFCGIIFFVTM